MRITIQCSNCGNRVTFPYSVHNVINKIKDGWGSFGSALYCPVCCSNWCKYNDKPLAKDDNTIGVIDRWARAQEGADNNGMEQ